MYKGFTYFRDSDGLWKVVLGSNVFIVALDDSKISGKKLIISNKNNVETCKKFIDWKILSN